MKLETDVCRREKCIEKENVCFEEARREGIKEDNKKLLICLRMCV
jgi:hypothetical protein